MSSPVSLPSGPDATKACPVCAETIKAAALKCRFCNTDLAVLQAEQEAAQERILFAGHPVLLPTLGAWALAVLSLGLALPYFWARSRALTYVITTQRIRIERGLFSKIESSVDLFRLDDFDIHRPLGMRLVGQAALHLRSSDPDMADASLYGVPGLVGIADQLRECAMRERTRRRVTTFVNA
jgi:uncharacterized membrane protein YdbT with pleckstrin-like domain